MLNALLRSVGNGTAGDDFSEQAVGWLIFGILCITGAAILVGTFYSCYSFCREKCRLSERIVTSGSLSLLAERAKQSEQNILDYGSQGVSEDQRQWSPS